MPTSPIRVAFMNDYELIVRGLGEMLAPHADRVEVVELVRLAPGKVVIYSSGRPARDGMPRTIQGICRKIGVARRPEAVRWGMENGFEPDRIRIIPGL